MGPQAHNALILPCSGKVYIEKLINKLYFINYIFCLPTQQYIFFAYVWPLLSKLSILFLGFTISSAFRRTSP